MTQIEKVYHYLAEMSDEEEAGYTSQLVALGFTCDQAFAITNALFIAHGLGGDLGGPYSTFEEAFAACLESMREDL